MSESTDRESTVTPRFSVLTSVFNPDPSHLEACLASVEQQTFAGSFEHIVVDDASSRVEVRSVLNGLEQLPWRHVIRRPANGGVVAASNDALAAASGDVIVLLDHDDVLAPEALSRLAEFFEENPDAQVVYSDHDLLRFDDRLYSPVFNPDFSPERLRNHNYITHLVAARRSLVVDIGGFTVGTDGAQDHDLLLRLSEHVDRFHHIPEILLHWRQSATSFSGDPETNNAAFEREVAVVAAHLERCGIEAAVSRAANPGVVRIERCVHGVPTVSVVIPTCGSRGRIWGVERIFIHDAVASLLADADDRIRFEIVAVIDADTDEVVERGLRQIVGDALRIVTYTDPFNFSDKINRGVAAATGDFVLLLNDDTELIAPGSVAEMVGLAQSEDIGMVGAKLLFEDGTLQHGGHLYHGTISHSFLGWQGDHPGPHRILAVERECAGVTAAAALLRREVFNRIGGMNTALPANYNDVDLSLTVRSAGYRIVWTPYASWYHFEQKSFDHPIAQSEIDEIERRWGDFLRHDPYSNPNLAPGRTDWLELPLRSGATPL
ncbi:glycosyltransferase family 2 protein [Ilumatobacter sp.]|uniref:glycosyltransferase family 2 protein n=1 Tax=Ilumatobacter sp. TaxID=1967498 RepID=UPI003C6AD9F7